MFHRQTISQSIQNQVKKGDIERYELNTDDDNLKSMFSKLFQFMMFGLRDIPPDFKFFLYIPVVKTAHDSLRPYDFYVQLTTPDNKTIISWKFVVNFLSSRKLHNVRSKKVPLTRNQMSNVEHEIKTQQYSKFIQNYLKTPKSQYQQR